MHSAVEVLLGLVYGIIGLVFAGWLHRENTETPPRFDGPSHFVAFYLTGLLWPVVVAILVPLVLFRILMVLVEERSQ